MLRIKPVICVIVICGLLGCDKASDGILTTPENYIVGPGRAVFETSDIRVDTSAASLARFKRFLVARIEAGATKARVEGRLTRREYQNLLKAQATLRAASNLSLTEPAMAIRQVEATAMLVAGLDPFAAVIEGSGDALLWSTSMRYSPAVMTGNLRQVMSWQLNNHYVNNTNYVSGGNRSAITSGTWIAQDFDLTLSGCFLIYLNTEARVQSSGGSLLYGPAFANDAGTVHNGGHIVPPPENEPCPPSGGAGGGGGGGGPECTQEYIILEINYNDGTGWHTLYEGYVTVCG